MTFCDSHNKWLFSVTLNSAFGIYTKSEQYILWTIMALTTNNRTNSAMKNKRKVSTDAVAYAYVTVVR